MLVKPLLQLVVILWLLTLLLRAFVYMVAAGVFYVVDPITPLIIKDVPQIYLRGSLALLGWWTRSMAASGRRIQSPSLFPELLLELSDELFLLLDDEVLVPDIVQERSS